MPHTKIDQADRLFSRLVRERAGWRCEACDEQFEEGDGGLQCSHFYSRRHQATRYHPLNAAAHCVACHFRFTQAPIVFAEWIVGHLGRDKAAQLRLMHDAIRRRPKHVRKALRKHLRAEMAEQHRRRMAGENGRLEFAAFD